MTKAQLNHSQPNYWGNDPVRLTQVLTRIDSSNPGLSITNGAGEGEIAKYIAAWLKHHEIEYYWIEKIKDRPSIVGVVRGSGGGKSLMLNGHIDTVTLAGYDGDALSGEIKGDKIHGRGTMDMKAGIAASMVALKWAKEMKLKGDVILAAVADEENLSIGHDVVVSHKGFVWLEVSILGVAAHGSRPQDGVDSISKAGYFLVELGKHARELCERSPHPELGTGIIHAGLIRGGEEPSTFPAKCTITIERRTIPGESSESVLNELSAILKQIAAQDPDFKFDIRVTFERPPFEVPKDHPFVVSSTKIITNVLGEIPDVRAESAWTDCALLSNAGIPTILFGPKGEGLHGKAEWVSIMSTRKVTEAMTRIIESFCA